MPRGNDIHARGARRVREHAHSADDEFDVGLIADLADERILQDQQLTKLEDTIATVEDVRDARRIELDHDDGPDPSGALADAVEEMAAVVDDRVEELFAEICKTVLVEGDQWVAEGHYERDRVERAKQEAASWLLAHEEACRRAFGGSLPDADLNLGGKEGSA